MQAIVLRRILLSVVSLVLGLLFSPAHAQDHFSLAEELRKPEVKLVVLEFYASYCMPCRAAVKDWDLMHQKYRAKGLRFVVVTLDEQGKCTDPGWSPDRVLCDKDRYWQKRYGVENLPQAFLYSWQGELLSERAHVEQVEKAIVRFFRETQLRMTIDQPEVVGDKYAIGSNPEWVRDYVRGEVRKSSKFDVVDEAAKALPKQLEGGQCSVSFPPNSDLRIKLFGDGEGNRQVTLTLEKDGCVLASSQQPYKGQGFREDADSLKGALREAVKGVLAAVTKVVLPAPMALQKPGGEDWFEEVEVAVVSFTPSPEAVVMVDGKLACPKTPCSKSYSPGSHEVTISAEYYVTRTETVTVSEDRTIAWKLIPDFGLLTMTSEPSGLPVKLNRQAAGVTPLEKQRVAPGSHVVELTHACYYPEQQNVTLGRGDEKTLHFKPKAIEGGLELGVKDAEGNVVRAEASLDGVLLGQAPGKFKASVCGKELKVTAPGYEKHEQVVAIREKQVTKVEVPLVGAHGGAPVSPTGLAMIRLEPGTFTMGSPSGEEGRYDEETQHKVTLTRPFLLGKTEVTQGQWQKVLGSNPSNFKNCGADCPVEQVSWHDVVEFCNKLSAPIFASRITVTEKMPRCDKSTRK